MRRLLTKVLAGIAALFAFSGKAAKGARPNAKKPAGHTKTPVFNPEPTNYKKRFQTPISVRKQRTRRRGKRTKVINKYSLSMYPAAVPRLTDPEGPIVHSLTLVKRVKAPCEADFIEFYVVRGRINNNVEVVFAFLKRERELKHDSGFYVVDSWLKANYPSHVLMVTITGLMREASNVSDARKDIVALDEGYSPLVYSSEF